MSVGGHLGLRPQPPPFCVKLVGAPEAGAVEACNTGSWTKSGAPTELLTLKVTTLGKDGTFSMKKGGGNIFFVLGIPLRNWKDFGYHSFDLGCAGLESCNFVNLRREIKRTWELLGKKWTSFGNNKPTRDLARKAKVLRCHERHELWGGQEGGMFSGGVACSPISPPLTDSKWVSNTFMLLVTKKFNCNSHVVNSHLQKLKKKHGNLSRNDLKTYRIATVFFLLWTTSTKDACTHTAVDLCNFSGQGKHGKKVPVDGSFLSSLKGLRHMIEYEHFQPW